MPKERLDIELPDEALPWWLEAPKLLPSAFLTQNVPWLCLDFETTTFSFGDATDPRNQLVCAAWYVQGRDKVEYHRGNELDQADLLADIEAVLSAGGFLVAHNIKFEYKWLIRMGLDPATFIGYDTMIGEHIIRANRQWMRVNLNETAQRYGCTAKAYTVDTMLKVGIDTTEMPPELVKARVVKDVKDTTRTFLRQVRKLQKDGQVDTLACRMIFTPVLADMETQGIHLAPVPVRQEYDRVLAEYQAAEREWNQKYPDMNPRSTRDMATLVYGDLKFQELQKRSKKIRNKPSKAFPNGAPKVDNGTLEKLECTTEAQVQFKELRARIGHLSAQLSKTLEFMRHIVEERECKFYGQFNQHIAATHRLSSSSVRVEFEDGTEKGIQLQNMPRAYKPMVCGPKGTVVGEVDGSQLEFRVAAFLGQDSRAISDIRNDIDRHIQTACQLYGIEEEDVTKEIRQGAKEETFKPLYGGRRGTPEQERYYKWFREQFPELAATQETWTYSVLANGEYAMPWGMKWYFPGTKQDPRSGYIDNTPSIYNYPVQNFATGEIIPIAVTHLWHRSRVNDPSIVLFNTVHDSAIAHFPPESGAMFRELSTQTFTLDVYEYLEGLYHIEFNVPLGVGITIGTRWASKDSQEVELNVERDGTFWYKGQG
ncbi:hypothetical protein CMI47_04615 [Candidatus Pacearchaeota archaeon]|jgi:DNA polymerase-1|nr:hypothetical protein [Candidatus Pacearchaeota archaeon]